MHSYASERGRATAAAAAKGNGRVHIRLSTGKSDICGSGITSGREYVAGRRTRADCEGV